MLACHEVIWKTIDRQANSRTVCGCAENLKREVQRARRAEEDALAQIPSGQDTNQRTAAFEPGELR